MTIDSHMDTVDVGLPENWDFNSRGEIRIATFMVAVPLIKRRGRLSASGKILKE